MIRTADIKSTSDIGYKDQNSSIHILEALTELYKVWKDPLVKERLQEMLYLIRDKMVTPKGYLQLYFTYDWKPISYRDSSDAVIKKNHYIDHVSFGHDVETAYLMKDATETLGNRHNAKTLAIGTNAANRSPARDNRAGNFGGAAARQSRALEIK